MLILYPISVVLSGSGIINKLFQMNIKKEIVDFKRGEIVYERDTIFGPRWQPHWQLVYLFSGRAEVFLDDKPPYAVESGQVTLLSPGRREQFHFAAGTRHGWCCAEPGSLPEALTGEVPGEVRVQSFTPEMQMLDRLVRVTGEEEECLGESARRLAVRALFAEYLDRARGARQGSSPTHPALEVAERRMRESLVEGFRLDELAAHASVSSAHLIRLYRECFGTTPIRRLWRLRLDRAEELLRRSGLTVAEISDRCGFANPQHFSKAFVRNFKETPRRHRLRTWGSLPVRAVNKA